MVVYWLIQEPLETNRCNQLSTSVVSLPIVVFKGRQPHDMAVEVVASKLLQGLSSHQVCIILEKLEFSSDRQNFQTSFVY